MSLEPLTKIMQTKSELKSFYERGIIINIKNWEEYINKFKNTRSSQPSKNFWKDKKVLITGFGGFLGSNLAQKLLEYDAKVIGIILHHDLNKYPNILDLKDRIQYYVCDLTDYGHVDEIIRLEKPDIVFHYAAISFVPTSLEEPNKVFQNNVGSTINILKAIAKYCKENVIKIYTALSSEQYGFVMNINELPIKETNSFRPCSPYAVSKIATEKIGESYYYTDSLPVLKIRTFNQEGVGDVKKLKRARDDRFFTMVVAKQIAEYLNEKRNKIIIGNPNVLRDFIDVKDSIIAHMLGIEKCEPNEPYNVCSNYGILTGDFVKIACKLYDIPENKIYVDISRIRSYEKYPALVHGFVGDNTKFVEKTGWKPTRSIKDIIKESVEYHIKRINEKV
jgi:GDP-4-dehydro-6-deoxy-D-mannose reductase